MTYTAYLNSVTRKQTGHATFDRFCDSVKGGYCPTIRADIFGADAKPFAEAFDSEMMRRGQTNRAYRSGF